MRHQPGPVPPLPGGVQRQLAPAARRTRFGLPCWAARDPVGAAVWVRRSCLPARSGQRDGWQYPKE
jgi:hypothetical protein